MIKSMTGYGYFSGQDERYFQVWEIKSVNSKQLNLRWKLPYALSSMEYFWDSEIRSVALRGKVDIFLKLEFLQSELLPISFSRISAEAMLRQLADFASAKGQSFEPDFNRFLAMPGLWQESAESLDEELMQSLKRGFRDAVSKWDQSRIQEGQTLKEDLLKRLRMIQSRIDELGQRANSLPEEKFQGLQQRLDSLLRARGVEIEEERLWQELALLADKVDISEEITRLHSHVSSLSQFLSSEKGGGRKLDFYLQECFREITTCGNKAQDSQSSRLVVECKTELEKCREQVQNLE